VPKKAKYEQIQGCFFRWRIRPSSHGVWYADGRSNQPSVGRHSLGTKDKNDALRLIQLWDARMAVNHGIADSSVLGAKRGDSITLGEGIKKYLHHISRPKVTGGAKKSTVKRYRPVFDKFAEYSASEGVEYWDQVNRRLLESYAGWLDDHGYAYRTEYMKLTTIKQCVNWLVSEKLISRECSIHMPMPKAQGSPTYCYSEAEVRGLICFCAQNDELIWLGRVLCTLVYTGMRIGEAAQLVWDDIDLDDAIVHVRDTSRGAATSRDTAERTTKSSLGRIVPLHRELQHLFGSMSGDYRGRVFHGPRRGRLKPDTVRNVLTRDVLPHVAKAMYPRDSSPRMLDGRVHSLRHTFCTIAYRAGWPERMIWMSWVTAAATSRSCIGTSKPTITARRSARSLRWVA
jgi:integrase